MQKKFSDIWKRSRWFQDNYDIVDPKAIGTGGFAEVYLVKEKSDNQEYALKVQVTDVFEDHKESIQEVHTILKLEHHQNIIK